MKTDPIAERAREALAAQYERFGGLADAARLRDPHGDHEVYGPAIDAMLAFAALTTESRPEGLEREAFDYRGNLARALFEASCGKTLIYWSDETRDFWLARADAALATPHPQANLQENLAGSQTDAPASGEVDTQLLQAIRDISQGGQPVEVVLHSDGEWEVRTSDAAIAMREANPLEGARDSALEEAGCNCAARHYGDDRNAHQPCCSALRTAKPEQADHVVGFADTDVEQPEQVGAGFVIGERVEKISGSSWRGRIVGTYSTTLTPEGYAVESDAEHGSVQIYPRKALRLLAAAPQGQNSGEGESHV